MNVKKTLVVGGLVTLGALTLGALIKKNKGNIYVEEYIINNLSDAEEVRKTLKEYANSYGSVTVADYLDLLGITSSFTDNTRGWSEARLSNVKIVKHKMGYIIKLPAVEVL